MKEWVYGRNAVYECLRAERRQVFRLFLSESAQEKGRLVEILALAVARRLQIERVGRSQLDRFGSGHQGVAMEVSGYPYCALADIVDQPVSRSEPAFVLILDTLQDPQNLGSLLRTAEIAGIHGVLLPLRHTATITPAVVNASSGASEHLLVAQVNLAQAILELKAQGVWVVGLESGPAARPIHSFHLDGPLALVVGSEGEGMRELTRKSCDVLLSLPMKGKIASLNAAVAGSIALYLAMQARSPIT